MGPGAFPQTLGGVLARGAAEVPDRYFVTVGGRTLSYAEFAEQVAWVAGALAELGIGRGDKVALFLPNSLVFLLAMFAVPSLGAMFVPAHAESAERELRYVLLHSDARAVVTDVARLPRVEAIRSEIPELKHVVVAGHPPGRPDTLTFEELCAAMPASGASVVPSDPAAILYTSGTTGPPKGAVLLHRGFVLNATAFRDHLGFGADDVLLCVLPLAHLNAQRSSILAAAVSGAHVVVAERFSASRFWETVREHQITAFSILPTILAMLLAQPSTDRDRDHSARLCISPASPEQLRAFEARFGVHVVTTYGLTEGMLNIMNPADRRTRRIGAVGRPIAPGVQRMRIVDPEGRDLPAGVTGEIVLQSPAQMVGYYKDPEATARALRDGWLYTGDLGWLDEDGFLYFVGRLKEMIRRGGENIAPGEVEAMLLKHPKVADAVVLGVPDPIYEEAIKACVVLHPGESPASVPPEALFAHCAARLAPFKVPRYLEYREELPRTPTLRVQRHLLTQVTSGENGPVFDRLAIKGESVL